MRKSRPPKRKRSSRQGRRNRRKGFTKFFRADEKIFRELRGTPPLLRDGGFSLFRALFGAHHYRSARNSPSSIQPKVFGELGALFQRRGFGTRSLIIGKFTRFSRKSRKRDAAICAIFRGKPLPLRDSRFPLCVRLLRALLLLVARIHPFSEKPKVFGKLRALAKSAIFARAVKLLYP